MQLRGKGATVALSCLWVLFGMGIGSVHADISLDPPVLLPDGSEFRTWRDETVYRKVYYVERNHPQASDDGDGTEASPFVTINRAAQVVRPGQKVVVKSGVYRELVRPRVGGTGPDAMISFEAVPGAEVILKGSEVFEPDWQPMQEHSGKVWRASLPADLFGSDNPFLTQNASEADIELMPWAKEWAGKLPYTLGRGLVFQNGKRLAQQANLEGASKREGSYWVDTENVVLYVHPYAGADPHGQAFEITTRQHIFKPAVPDLGYIRVKGFVIEHAGNGLPRTGVGALFTMGGHHWVIEDNVVRQVNSVGIEIGARTDESRGSRVTDVPRAERSPGCMIVRNNELYECGTGGIQGLLVKSALVEDNRIHHCGWQDVQRYWETGAIKLLLNRGTLVRRNVITDIQAAPGIWLDYDNINSRVTQNILVNIESVNGAIFIEASQVPNLVDRNFLWNIQGSGIYQHDCDELTIAHNFVAHCTKYAVEMRICEGRVVNGRLSTCKRNALLNNVFVDASMGIFILDDENRCDNNLFAAFDAFDFDAWRARGFGTHSVKADLHISFEAETMRFSWSCPEALPRFAGLKTCARDFFEAVWAGEKVPAGPFPYPGTSTTHMNLR